MLKREVESLGSEKRISQEEPRKQDPKKRKEIQELVEQFDKVKTELTNLTTVFNTSFERGAMVLTSDDTFQHLMKEPEKVKKTRFHDLSTIRCKEEKEEQKITELQQQITRIKAYDTVLRKE